MSQTNGDSVHYAPLYIHSFRLIAPRRLLQIQSFQKYYQEYGNIETIQERLRWLRYQKGLMQEEVAAFLGIPLVRYKTLEYGCVDYIAKPLVDKLSALYNIAPCDFLDGYSLFLYHGQGKQLRAYRQQYGLSRAAFAKQIHASLSSLSCWETDKKRMHRIQWEKYFKDLF